MSGYYLNSLREWHADLMRDRKRIISRLRALERQNHPCAPDQKLLFDINERFLGIINDALEESSGG